MTSTSDEVPTSSQLLSLTNLILEQPTPPPFTSVLNEFLHLLSEPWILTFLFTPDPIHLTHLTSSTLPSTAVTSSLTTTRVQPPSSQPDPISLSGESHHERAHFVLVPVFTLGDITVGVGVSEALENLGTPWLPPAFASQNAYCSNFRFLRDARTRAILVLTDAPQEDSVMVYYARNQTLTRCHSFQAGFRRAQFLDLVQNGDSQFHIDTLLPACQFIISEVQHRKCPLCPAPFKTPCACEFPVPPVAHPLDNSHFLASFLEDFGVYEGVASKLIPGDSGLNRHTQLGVRVSCQGFVDFNHNLVKKLSQWSVSGYLSAQSHDPRHSNLSRKSYSPVLQVNYPAGSNKSNQVFDTGIWDDEQADPASWLQETLELLFPHDGGQSAVRDHGRRSSNTRQLSWRPGSSSRSTEPSVNVTAEAMSEKGMASIPVPDIPVPDFELINDALWWDERISADTDSGLANADVNVVAENRNDVSGNVSTVEEISFRAGETDETAGHVSRNQEIAAIAPATILATPVVGRQAAEEAALIAKEMKAEERRRRNRLSAQRSNMKRKEACDAIRVQLKSLRAKIETLKEKEGRLKEENLEMRKKVEEGR